MKQLTLARGGDQGAFVANVFYLRRLIHARAGIVEVFRRHAFQHRRRVGAHGAELNHVEHAVVGANSSGPEKHRPFRVELDEEGR